MKRRLRGAVLAVGCLVGTVGVCRAQASIDMLATPKMVLKTTTGCGMGRTLPLRSNTWAVMKVAALLITATWTGDCVDGQVSGTGIATVKVLSVEFWHYEGGMQHGLFNGQGSFHTFGGVTASGVWQDAKLIGQASITVANGYRYEGGWDVDHKEGFGVETEVNGLRYEGTFVNGKRDGHGVLTSPRGVRIEAEWKDGVMSGHGSAVSANTHFDGMFQNGRFNGPGVLVTKNGSRYEGNFRDGLPDGEGTLALPGKPTVTGTWVHGCIPLGNGILSFGIKAIKCKRPDSNSVASNAAVGSP